MKRKGRILCIVLLCITSITLVGYCFSVRTTRDIQHKVDTLFRESLIKATEGFALDYSKMDQDSKLSSYISTASELKAARNLVSLTSYNEKNKYLYTSLNNLYLSMTNTGSRELILKQEKKVFEYIYNIVEDPANTEAAKELEKMAGDIFFNINGK